MQLSNVLIVKMAPAPYLAGSEYSEEPISRTYQYRKVMKPMLERKRRARINRCLDELKELMVTALQNEGENVSKLEKADILELTVRHLHGLKRQQQLVIPQERNYIDKFRDGFTQCAQEVTHFMTTPSELVDPVAGKKLLQHLGACVRQLESVTQNPSYQCSQKNIHSQTGTASVNKNVPPPSMWRPW